MKSQKVKKAERRKDRKTKRPKTKRENNEMTKRQKGKKEGRTKGQNDKKTVFQYFCHNLSLFISFFSIFQYILVVCSGFHHFSVYQYYSVFSVYFQYIFLKRPVQVYTYGTLSFTF